MNELLTITSPLKGSFLIKTFIAIFKMDRGHLSSRKCLTKSKGLSFNTVLSKEESDDSDVENYESDAEYLEDYIVTKESNEKGLGLMAIKCFKKVQF